MQRSGFTLIEMILVLIIGAIMGAVAFQFTSNAGSSVSPVVWMQREYSLQKKMEQITSRYRKAITGKDFRLDSFYSEITSDNRFKKYIDTKQSGYLVFKATGPKKFQAAGTQTSPATSSLLITITDEAQSLVAVFSGVGQP